MLARRTGLAGRGVGVGPEPTAGLACGAVGPAGEDFPLRTGVGVARGIVDEVGVFMETICLSTGLLDGREGGGSMVFAGGELGAVAVAAVGQDGERGVGC